MPADSKSTPSSKRHGSDLPHLVLVGAGHTHLLVLRSWIRNPPRAQLTVIVDDPISVYSGMVPGLLGGEYTPDTLSIDVGALAARAGAGVVCRAAHTIDAASRRIFFESGEPISYDVASLNIGAASRGLELPGVAEFAVPSRPIATLAQRLAARPQGRIAVVGGGAAGVELAFALIHLGPLVLVHHEPRLLADHPLRVSKAIEDEARRAGIELRHGEASAVDAGGVTLATGQRLDAALVIWATGSAPPGLLARSDLPLDAEGFVCVEPTLQVKGHPRLFAAGDCASLAAVPRNGVFAVREGPILDANLRAQLLGEPLKPFRPQHRFLTLLNLGGGRALGTRNGIVVAGKWVRRWKDRIDRRFVDQFRAGPPSAPS